MKSEANKSNILKFRKSRHLNIGIVIFGIIFIYLIATIIMYITAPRITSYEVRQGSILKDHTYTALAIREEMLVTANDSGYVNYYAEDNSKAKVGTAIYTISTQELHFDNQVSDENATLSASENSSLSEKVQTFNENFQSNDFSSVYNFKNDMQNTIAEYTSYSRLDQFHQMMNSGTYSDVFMKYSDKDGVVILSYDGMESLTTDSVTEQHLTKDQYVKNEFENNASVMNGDPIYKLITSDYWHLMFEISDETAKSLAEKNTVKIKFKKDNQELRAGFEIVEKKGTKVVILNMNNSMIRYCNDRYLDIELILEDETGLKIPKTAETTKDFYVVPASYLTQGGDSSDDGVLLRSTNSDDETITEFFPVTVYYQEDELIYLDPNVFKDGATLLKPESSETYTLSDIRSLKGVYCINKGYAVFKQIEILCESDDYYIVEEGNDFGLSNYDHIALHSEGIIENDVVF